MCFGSIITPKLEEKRKIEEYVFVYSYPKLFESHIFTGFLFLYTFYTRTFASKIFERKFGYIEN